MTDTPRSDRLRLTAVVFPVAVAAPGADSLRRGVDAITGVVLGAGTTQFVVGALAVVLLFRRHRWAPAVATAVGMASTVGVAGPQVLRAARP